MTRGECCPNCKKAVVGLYYNYRETKNKRNLRPQRKAFYCKHCDLVLKDNEVVYKKIIYERGVKK